MADEIQKKIRVTWERTAEDKRAAEETKKSLLDLDITGRQLKEAMFDLGGAIGGTAQQAMQLAGRLGSALLSANPLVSAIRLLSVGIDTAQFAMRYLRTETDKLVESLKQQYEAIAKLRGEVDKLIESRNAMLAGVTEEDAKIRELRTRYRELGDQIVQLAEKEKDAMRLRGVLREEALKRLRNEITRARNEQVEIELDIERLQRVKTAAEARKRTDEKERADADRREAEKREAEKAREQREAQRRREMAAMERERAAEYAAAIRAEEEAMRRMLRLREEYYNAEMDAGFRAVQARLELDRLLEESRIAAEDRISQAVLENAEMQADYYRDTAQQIIDIVGVMGDAIGRHTKAGKALTVAAIVAEATLRVSQEIGAALSALGGPPPFFIPNPAAAAFHFASAAKYAIVAGVNVAGAVGGGGASSPAARTAARGGADAERGEGGTFTLIINGNILGTRESGRQIREWLDEAYYGDHPGAPRKEVRL